MIKRTAEVVWEGGFKDGKGQMKLGSGAFVGSYSADSRFENGSGTNPEELIGAAHAGCFSMAFSVVLEKAGYKPNKIETNALVTMVREEQGFKIDTIDLSTKCDINDIDDNKFHELAEAAKQNCPVSKALAGVKINLKSELVTASV